jgi:MFS family permease
VVVTFTSRGYASPVSVEWPSSSEQQELVADLEHDLRDFRPVTIGALLVATALLRVAAIGTGVAIQFRLADIAGQRPNEVTIGLVGAAQGLTEMIFAPILARYADRFGRTRFLVLGPLIGSVSVFLVALAGQSVQIGGARLLEGIAAAAFVPVALGTVAAATARDRAVRAGASGAFEGATLAGYAGGFAVGGFAYFGLHRGAFLVLGGLYLISALVCLVFVPRVPPLPVSPLRTVLRTVLGHGPIRAFLPGWLAVFALLGAFAAHLPSVLRQFVPGQTLSHHFDQRLISLFLDSWIVLFLIGIVLWTPLLTRFPPALIMRRAIPGAWVVLIALLGINHTHLSVAPFFIPVLALGILWLAGFGPAAITYLADSSEALVADRSALMSFYTVTLAGGGALGAVLGGVAIRYLHADGLLLVAFVFSLVTFASIGFVLRYARGSPSSVAPG